jgi:hypothetical protein
MRKYVYVIVFVRSLVYCVEVKSIVLKWSLLCWSEVYCVEVKSIVLKWSLLCWSEVYCVEVNMSRVFHCLFISVFLVGDLYIKSKGCCYRISRFTSATYFVSVILWLVKRGGKLPPHLIALLQKDTNTVTQVSNTVTHTAVYGTRLWCIKC